MTTSQYQKWYFKKHKVYENLALSILISYLRKVLNDAPEMTEANYERVLNSVITTQGMRKAYEKLYLEVGTLHGKRIDKGINSGLLDIKAFNLSSLFSQSWFKFMKTYFDNIENLLRIRTVTEDLIRSLSKIITDALSKGEGIEPIVRSLRKDVGRKAGLLDWQLRRIARTETGASANLSAFQAMADSRLVIDKVWVARLDKRTRDGEQKNEFDHYYMDNKVKPLLEPFDVPNENGDIEPMLYPCDTNGSASNVINCRCALAPKVRRQSNGLPMLKTDLTQ